MTTDAAPRRVRKRPAFERTTDPEHIAYLRLRGIAEREGRVVEVLERHYYGPACAVGLFRMSLGWYVVAGFIGEQHWRALARTRQDGLEEYLSILGEIATRACR